MKILSIETSCDETAVSIVEAEGGLVEPHFRVLGNALFSQVALHKEYGGVVPMLAKREHEKNLPILLKKVLEEAGVSDSAPGVDMIAVTSGPGLEPALWVGIEFAIALGKQWSVPVIPVNHMEGHITSVLMDISGDTNTKEEVGNENKEEKNKIQFPALAVLISGGHTEIVSVENWGRYNILGQTRDDAEGEAFDKVARLLGLPYPGGPEISRLAAIAREENLPHIATLPRPMLHSQDLDFSFSGLKTAVLYYIRDTFKDQSLTDIDKKDIAREFEDAVVDVLMHKTKQALNEVGAETLIVAGGVIANKKLRESFTALTYEYTGLIVKVPTKDMATDNSLMIACAGYVQVTLHPDLLMHPPEKIIAQGNLKL